MSLTQRPNKKNPCGGGSRADESEAMRSELKRCLPENESARVRKMIRRGLSSRRIAELTGVPSPVIHEIKQRGLW